MFTNIPLLQQRDAKFQTGLRPQTDLGYPFPVSCSSFGHALSSKPSKTPYRRFHVFIATGLRAGFIEIASAKRFTASLEDKV